MHVYFVECMLVCVDSLTCCLRGPRGRLAMPNELPSINKDFHFTSLHFFNIGCIGRHVISSLSANVTMTSKRFKSKWWTTRFYHFSR